MPKMDTCEDCQRLMPWRQIQQYWEDGPLLCQDCYLEHRDREAAAWDSLAEDRATNVDDDYPYYEG